ncbi:MAG: NUDIX hydrolase [Anaerolineaceae bacterium]|nr:NUDIX hydrolase [Anaerolineaceae bacterium]
MTETDNHETNKKEKKNKIRFKHRAVGVAIRDGHILIHHCKSNGYWSLPGGHVDRGESTQDAIKREFLEETGMRIRVKRLLWVSEQFYKKSTGKQIHEIAFYYLIELKNEGLQPFTGSEKGKTLYFHWVPMSDLKQYQLLPVFLKNKLLYLPDHPEHVIRHSPWPT